jgi:hypothetical protein
MPEALLIIEDEVLLGAELQRRYQRSGWHVPWAKTLQQAKRALLEQGLEPLVVLSDMSLPDGNALDLLEELRGRGAAGEWIFSPVTERSRTRSGRSAWAHSTFSPSLARRRWTGTSFNVPSSAVTTTSRRPHALRTTRETLRYRIQKYGLDEDGRVKHPRLRRRRGPFRTAN